MGRKKAKKDSNAESVAKRLKALNFTESREVKKQVSVLAKLTDWQKKSAGTEWIIGEYLNES